MKYNAKTEYEYQDIASRWWSHQLDDGTITTGTKNCTLQVTENCNLACTYCYQICKSKSRMSFDTAKKYIDTILTDKEIDRQYESLILDFIGGEPLLEIDLIDKVIDYFRIKAINVGSKFGYRYRISMCSNGLLYLAPKVQEFFKKHHNNLSFSISIDGNKMLHDACRVTPDGKPSYDIAIKSAMKYRDQYGSLPGTKMTLAPENIKYTYEALLNMINIGYTNVFSNCVYEAQWSPDDARELYYGLKKLADYLIDNDLEDKIHVSMFDNTLFHPLTSDDNQNWCGGNGEMIALGCDGIIYPCLRYMKSSLGDSRPTITCGTVDSGIDHDKLDCMKCVTRLSQSTEECINCPVAAGCSWCTAYNYQLTGSINKRVTNICIMHKSRSLANAYYWNKVYHKHNDTERFKINLSDEDALKIIDVDELLMLHELER